MLLVTMVLLIEMIQTSLLLEHPKVFLSQKMAVLLGGMLQQDLKVYQFSTFVNHGEHLTKEMEDREKSTSVHMVEDYGVRMHI